MTGETNFRSFYFRKNKMTAYDNYIQLGQYVEYEWCDVYSDPSTVRFAGIEGFPVNHTDFSKPLTHEHLELNQWSKYELYHYQLEHERVVYGILDALGDYGGV